MPNFQPYRNEDSPDTSGVTGPVSGAGRPRSPSSHSGLSSGAFFTAPEPRPERIGPYKIVGELGRGGMGVVYLAIKENDQFKTRVALKVVKRGMDSEEIVRRFNIERQVLAALNHPNIARLIDAATMEDGRPYFVMEYIEGKPIDRHCDEEKMSIDKRLALFRQVCAGVQHAHQNLIVHRDLKPSNVLVTSKGDVKLMDFGIAKVLNPQLAAVMGDPTEVGLRVMTTEYASPEQVRGDPIGTSSDIYSLGVLLYELLTGRRPYRFRTKLEEEIKRIVCDSEPSRPSTAVTTSESYVTSGGESRTLDATELARPREGMPERLKKRLSGDIDNIVMMAMRKETTRRYVSAEQFAEDIKRHLDGRPVIASPDRSLYRFGKFLKRNRIAMGSLAAVMLALAAGLSVALYQRGVAVEQRGIAEQRNTQLTEAIGYIDTGLNRVFTQYDTEVSKLEGGMKAREVLVKALREHLDAMPKPVMGFPAAEKHRATVLTRMGDLTGGLRSPTQNLPAEALALYDQALAIRKQIAEAPGATSDDRHKYAGMLLRRADALNKMDRLEDAARSSDEARAVLQNALKTDPQAPAGLRRMLADVVTSKGQVLLDQGKHAEALAEFEKASVLYAALLSEDSKDQMNNRRNIAVIANKIGDALTAAGRNEEALARYESSLDLRKQFFQEEPNDRTKRDLAVSHHLTAKCQCRLKRWDAAEQNAATSVSLIQDLVQANADQGGRDNRAVRDLATFDKALSEIKAAKAAGTPCT